MKKLLFLLTCCSIGLLNIGCSEDETPGFGSVYGIVTDANTHQPIYGASVVLSPGNFSSTTGQDGHYEFVDLEPGQYKIQVQSNGYYTNSRQIRVNPGSSATGDMTLSPIQELPGIQLSSMVLDFGSKYPELPLTISNPGTAGTIDWSISDIDASWLSASPTSGKIDMNESYSVKVTADRSLVTEDMTTYFRINTSVGSMMIQAVISTGSSEGGNGGNGEDDPDQPAVEDVTTGLYALYTFENNTKNTVDGATDAVPINAPTYVEGMKGSKAIKFSTAANSYIQIPEGLIDGRNVTISFWAKGINDGHFFHVITSSYGQNQAFSLTMADGFLKYVASSYVNHYRLSSITPFAHPSFDNNWHMITLVSDFGKISSSTARTKLYIDGEYCDIITDERPSNYEDYGQGIKFVFGGSYEPSSSYLFNGISATIDNLRVYNTRCLSDDEVKQVYNYEK